MIPALHLITPPDEDVVTLAEAKAQLRITGTDEDDLITALIASAVAQIDPAFGGTLGRALRPQTWELRWDGFPYYYGLTYTRNFHPTLGIELPYPPVISVDSVKYDDRDGVEQTLVEGVGYRVFGIGSLTKTSIMPIYNGTWPSSVRNDTEAVRIRFTAGYEDEDLPAPIKQAVLLGVRNMYGLGERNLFVSEDTVAGIGTKRFVVSDVAAKVMQGATESLLRPYQVWD